MTAFDTAGSTEPTFNDSSSQHRGVVLVVDDDYAADNTTTHSSNSCYYHYRSLRGFLPARSCFHLNNHYTFIVLLFSLMIMTILPHQHLCEARLLAGGGGANRNNNGIVSGTSSTRKTTDYDNSILPSNNRNSNTSLCDAIHPENLPDECICHDGNGPYSLIIDCDKTFNNTYLNDTIGISLILDPCNPDGSKLDIDITEKDHNIDYQITGIKAGETKNIPIPGLAVIVPGIGHVGMDVTVYISGNPDYLTLKVGLNACAQFNHHHNMVLCADSFPGLNQVLPWWILQDTYSFGHFCNDTTTITTTTTISTDDADATATATTIRN